MSQKDNQAEVLSVHSLQVESILPVAHNEEKVKTTSFMFLMFLCQKHSSLYQNTCPHVKNTRPHVKNTCPYVKNTCIQVKARNRNLQTSLLPRVRVYHIIDFVVEIIGSKLLGLVIFIMRFCS